MADRAYLTEAMPMAVVWGRDDKVLPVRHASNVAALAPDAPVRCCPTAGHFPHQDHPEEFVRLLDQFVTATDAVASTTAAKFRRMLRHGTASATAARSPEPLDRRG